MESFPEVHLEPHSRFLSSCSILSILDKVKCIIGDMTFYMDHSRPSSAVEYHFLLYLSASSMHILSKLLLYLDAADGIFSFSNIRLLLRELEDGFLSRLSVMQDSDIALGNFDFSSPDFPFFPSYEGLDLPEACISFADRLISVQNRIVHFDCLIGLAEKKPSDFGVDNINAQIDRLSAAFLSD